MKFKLFSEFNIKREIIFGFKAEISYSESPCYQLVLFLEDTQTYFQDDLVHFCYSLRSSAKSL